MQPVTSEKLQKNVQKLWQIHASVNDR